MKRTIIIAIFLAVNLAVSTVAATGIATPAAEGSGIDFYEGTYEEARQKAIAAGKPLFLEFYTDWCGPCHIMAREVFINDEVGEFYNASFVNIKINAERGQGKEITAKFSVKNFPSFVFIDPNTEEIKHFSISRQDVETFLYTGQSALDPTKSSIYLNEQMKQGNTEIDFLLDYAYYKSSVHDRNEVTRVMAMLQEAGAGLDNERMWKLFVSNSIDARDSLSNELFNNKTELEALYGEKAVEDKLFSLLNFQWDKDIFDAAPEFRGKDYLWLKNNANKYVRNQNYDKAAKIIDTLMADPGEFQADLCDFFMGIVRMDQYRSEDPDWSRNCMVYAQYMAYNGPDRNIGMYHYYYAVYLEKLLRTVPGSGEYAPDEYIEGPSKGYKEYTMRPRSLKQKPSYEKRKK